MAMLLCLNLGYQCQWCKSAISIMCPSLPLTWEKRGMAPLGVPSLGIPVCPDLDTPAGTALTFLSVLLLCRPRFPPSHYPADTAGALQPGGLPFLTRSPPLNSDSYQSFPEPLPKRTSKHKGGTRLPSHCGLNIFLFLIYLQPLP